MRHRRSQAAMEFVLTYGWAMLVVLIALTGLWYFGILQPGKTLPEACIGSPGLDCLEKASAQLLPSGYHNVTIVLKSNLVRPINITGVFDAGDSNAQSCLNATERANATLTNQSGAWVAPGVIYVFHGQEILLSILCSKRVTTGSIAQDITIAYISENDLEQRAKVSIRARA